jgi:hypothetical protein
MPGSAILALINDATHLACRSLNACRLEHLDAYVHTDSVLDEGRKRLPGSLGVTCCCFAPSFHADGQCVQPALLCEYALKMWRQFWNAEDEFLDLCGEQVHATKDDHVVGATGYSLHPPHRSSGTR